MNESTMLYTVGALIVANVGTIGAVLYAAAKGVWWMARLDMRVEQNEKDVNSAFSKIRDVEIRFRNQ